MKLKNKTNSEKVLRVEGILRKVPASGIIEFPDKSNVNYDERTFELYIEQTEKVEKIRSRPKKATKSYRRKK